MAASERTRTNPNGAVPKDQTEAAIRRALKDAQTSDKASYGKVAIDRDLLERRAASVIAKRAEKIELAEDQAANEIIKDAEELLREQGYNTKDARAAVAKEIRGDGGLAEKVVDIGAVIREGLPPVEHMPGLGYRLAYAEGVTGFSGHPESGKTSLVLRLAIDAMEAGQEVIYLDWENGRRATAQRFAILGADDDLLSRYLTYVPFPGAVDWDEIEALWDQHPGAVVIWDSLRGILRNLGLDEDRAPEVSQFLDPLTAFALARGVPSLLLDHMPKAAGEDTGYPRGSGDKLAAVQAQYFVKKTRDFSEVEIGEIELIRWKAREGELDRRHRFEVGDGAGALTFKKLHAATSPEGKLDTRIIEFLRSEHERTSGITFSGNEIVAKVKGEDKKIRERVKDLAESEAQPVKKVDVNGQERFAFDPRLTF